MVPNEDDTPLGYLVNLDTGKRWPILEYGPDGRLVLFGAYSAFDSSLQKAASSGYVLDSDHPGLVALFLKTRREYRSPSSVFAEEIESGAEATADQAPVKAGFNQAAPIKVELNHAERVALSCARYEMAIARKYPPQEYLTYQSVDSILDAHPDFHEAQKVFAENRERLICFLEKQRKAGRRQGNNA